MEKTGLFEECESQHLKMSYIVSVMNKNSLYYKTTEVRSHCLLDYSSCRFSGIGCPTKTGINSFV